MKTANFDFITELIQSTISNEIIWHNLNDLKIDNRNLKSISYKGENEIFKLSRSNSFYFKSDKGYYFLIEFNFDSYMPNYLLFFVEKLSRKEINKNVVSISSHDEPLLYKLAVIVKNQTEPPTLPEL